MRIGTVTTPPAVRNASRIDGMNGTESVTPVRRITPEWIDEDPLDELTQSDRALLGHLYDEDGTAEFGSAAIGSLTREINRERSSGMVAEGRDLTSEDLRRMIGRLTFTAKEPVPVEVQLRLMTMLNGSTHGRLDVVL